MLLPFFNYEYKAKNKKEKVALKVLQDSLKKSNEVTKYVMSVLPYIESTIAIANELSGVEVLNDQQKLKLGMHLREAGHRWESIFMLAIAEEYCRTHYPQDIDPKTATSEFDMSEEDLTLLVNGKYSHLNKLINDNHLQTIHLVKPMLDGNQLCDLYKIKPGKALKFLMEECLKYQIVNPKAEYSQVEEHMLQN